MSGDLDGARMFSAGEVHLRSRVETAEMEACPQTSFSVLARRAGEREVGQEINIYNVYGHAYIHICIHRYIYIYMYMCIGM